MRIFRVIRPLQEFSETLYKQMLSNSDVIEITEFAVLLLPLYVSVKEL